jgi:hypothetical protein
MAAALLPVHREGKRRLDAFGKRKGKPAPRGEERGAERESGTDWESGAERESGADRESRAEREKKTGKTLPVRALFAVCACALCILGNAQIQVMGLASDSVAAMQPIYRELSFPVILLIFAVFTPFAEEFVFRGLLYTGFRRFLSPLYSILLGGALFGLYHGELIQGTYAFLMGMFFCLSMEVTGDLRMPWLLHGLSNGLPLCLSYLGIWESFLLREWRLGTFACLLFAAGGLAAYMLRTKRARNPKA